MQAAALWNRYMKCYDFLNRVDDYVENLKAIAAYVPGHARVLDAGSGTGNLSVMLKEKGAEVTALDFSDSAIRQHLAKDPNAQTMKASLEERLPLKSDCFDRVCCASVLFALSEPGRAHAMSEFWRVLKPGGELLVTVAAPCQRNGNLVGMHLRGLVRRSGWILGSARFLLDISSLLRVMYFNRRLRQLPRNQGYHRLSPEELSGLAENAGFEAYDLKYTYSGRFMLLHAAKPA